MGLLITTLPSLVKESYQCQWKLSRLTRPWLNYLHKIMGKRDFQLLKNPKNFLTFSKLDCLALFSSFILGLFLLVFGFLSPFHNYGKTPRNSNEITRLSPSDDFVAKSRLWLLVLLLISGYFSDRWNGYNGQLAGQYSPPVYGRAIPGLGNRQVETTRFGNM